MFFTAKIGIAASNLVGFPHELACRVVVYAAAAALVLIRLCITDSLMFIGQICMPFAPDACKGSWELCITHLCKLRSC